jgi:signal transduction histidine kinase
MAPPLSARLNRALHLVRLQHAIVIFSAAVVIAFGANMTASLQRSHRQTMQDAAEKLEGVARAAEVGTMRTIFEIDAMLLGVDRMLESFYPDQKLSGAGVKGLLRQINEQTLTVRDIILLDDTGTQVNTAASTPSRLRNFADRPFFTAHKEREGLPSLFIGAPERSRNTGAWSIMMSRPLLRGDRFVGVLVAEVPMQTFNDFFNSIVTTPATRVSLLRDDGSLMASEPHQEEAIGRMPAFAPRVLAQLATSRSGTLLSSGAEDESPRLRSFRTVPARPLIVAASREEASILAGWEAERRNGIVTFAIFAATAASLTWMLVRALQRQQATTSKLRRSEGRLEEQTRLLQSTLEHMGEGLSVFDRDGQLVAWNARFLELIELPASVGIGTSIEEVLTIQATRGDFGEIDVETEVADRLERFVREPAVTMERQMRNGRWLLVRRRRMPEGGVVTLYSDITDSKAFEERLVEARNQAELANRAKSEFLANMSHELRTPLNAIIGFSEIMRKEFFGPLGSARYKDYAADINNSGVHLLDLINDVLDMSKIEAGKLELHEETVSLQEACLAALSMVRERARSRGIKVLANLEGPELMVWADQRSTKQILLNILSNAVKFSREGGVVTADIALAGRGEPCVEIRDQGIGMTPEELARALEPFGQAQSTTTKRYEGTGLGLPITRRLVELHGGRLEFETQPGQGTLVRILLPRERVIQLPANADLAAG